MRSEKPVKLYVTFYTFSEAMATEAACKRENLSGKLVSVPRKLSAGCGVAWECAPELKSHIIKLLEEEDIEFEEMAELSA